MLGTDLIDYTLKGFLRQAFAYIPEEGIEAVVANFLTTEDMMAHVSFHVGTKDLILCEEYPPSRTTLANVFRAIFGALSLRYILDKLFPPSG